MEGGGRGWRGGGGGWRGRGVQNGDKQKKCCWKRGSEGKGEVLGSVADPKGFIPDPNPTIESFQIRTPKYCQVKVYIMGHKRNL